jgi:2',3'-cyclic-nucleotide 2'-phosphodiesterase (5'-nucleotidase family)
MGRRRRSDLSLGVCALVLALSACQRAGVDRTGVLPASSSSSAPSPAPRVTIRLLYTSDEHGWIAQATEKERTRGGAAALLAKWRAEERHCVPTAENGCESAFDLALSGGDNWTGPAISSYFHGEPAARAFHLLGYSASAIGNHELDFGRATFEKNVALEAVPYVAANVSPSKAEGGPALPYVLVHRAGVTIGVVGLATRSTPKHGLRNNYEGLTFADEEGALVKAATDARAAGADVVVEIGHVCAVDLQPIVERHPELHLAFAGAGHCHRIDVRRAGETPVAEPGSYLRAYLRASIVVDLSRPKDDRWIRTDVEVVDLTRPSSQAAPYAPDDAESKLVAEWQAKVDEALGEVIGFTNEPLESDSAPLTNFITDSWREFTHADVAILNRSGTRQAIPRGPITRETIVSVMPFDNRLVSVKVTGEQMIRDVTCCRGHVAGVRERGGKLEMANGDPIDPARTYSVVTTDYSYFGGSDFPFEKQDPSGVVGEDWREPVIAWLRAHPTTAQHGLDTMIDKTPRPNDLR